MTFKKKEKFKKEKIHKKNIYRIRNAIKCP